MKTLVISDVFTPSIISDMQQYGTGNIRSISSTEPKTLIKDLNVDGCAVEIYCTPNVVVPTTLQRYAAENNWPLKSIPENFTADGDEDTIYMFIDNNEWWLM